MWQATNTETLVKVSVCSPSVREGMKLKPSRRCNAALNTVASKARLRGEKIEVVEMRLKSHERH
jgi:hypothetical protein